MILEVLKRVSDGYFVFISIKLDIISTLWLLPHLKSKNRFNFFFATAKKKILFSFLYLRRWASLTKVWVPVKKFPVRECYNWTVSSKGMGFSGAFAPQAAVCASTGGCAMKHFLSKTLHFYVHLKFYDCGTRNCKTLSKQENMQLSKLPWIFMFSPKSPWNERAVSVC